jgi:hypothetical protein
MVVTLTAPGASFFSRGAAMKNYWIVFAIFVVTAWSATKGYAVGTQQSSAEANPGKQVQSSTPSEPLSGTKNPSVPQKPAGSGAVPVSSQPASVKSKNSYMLVELSQALKAKKLKVGDKVGAEIAQDVVSHGKIVIPVETKLVGHVTEVSARDGGHSESRLGIVFDRILLRHHQEINFKGVIQAVSQPVVRRSRVDEPSQMLPPSMGGGMRVSPNAGGGRGSSASGRSSGAPTTASASMATLEIPVTVKESPSTHADSPGAMLAPSANGKPMSIGMPQGVTGIKGLSLSAAPSPSTPGPVIISNTNNVKLDSGTQILLHVLNVEVPENLKPSK